jgi:Protein ENHANCED DISEASE RESISTANCE 2, C-terminal
MGFCVEGKEESELPEVLFGCVALNYPSVDKHPAWVDHKWVIVIVMGVREGIIMDMRNPSLILWNVLDAAYGSEMEMLLVWCEWNTHCWTAVQSRTEQHRIEEIRSEQTSTESRRSE